MTRRGRLVRIFAPLALIAFGVALVLVISSGGGGGGGGSGGSHAAEKARDLGPTAGRTVGTRHTRTTTTGQLPQRIYIVKTGDTLGGIAQKTGVPVTKLQDLNPGLDPSGLQTGQQIKLR